MKVLEITRRADLRKYKAMFFISLTKQKQTKTKNTDTQTKQQPKNPKMSSLDS